MADTAGDELHLNRVEAAVNVERECDSEEEYEPEDSESDDESDTMEVELDDDEGGDSNSSSDGDDDEEDSGQGNGGRSLPIRYLAEALQSRETLATIRAIVERELRQNPDFFIKHAPDVGGTTPLHDAIWCNAPLDVIEYLFEKRPDSLKVRRYGRDLPLHLALLGECGSDVATRLLELWPEAALEPTSWGCLPLHLAVRRTQGHQTRPSDLDVLERLIGAFPQALREKDEGGQLPLHCLLSCTDGVTLEAVTIIVEAFPDALDVGDDQGFLPIHVAAVSSTVPLDVLQFLVRVRPTSIRERTSHGGRLPIHGASEAPLLNLKLLVDCWPESLEEKDDEGLLPLHCAARHDAPLVTIRFLVERVPESVRAKDKRGRIPLHVAAIRGHIVAFEYLHRKWPESAREKDVDGCLPFHLALGDETTASVKGAAAYVVHYLLEQSPEALWVADHRGRLPLHYAATRSVGYQGANQDVALTRLIAARGSDALRHRDLRGNLVLHVAVSSTASLEKVRMLLEPYPEAVQVRNVKRQLPVHVALSRETPDVGIVQYLLEQHPDSVRAIDGSGRTLLHLAVRARSMHRRRHADFVLSLVQQWNEAVQVRDSRGFLPFHVAAWGAAKSRPPDLVYYLARLRPELVRPTAAAAEDAELEPAGPDGPIIPASKKPRLS